MVATIGVGVVDDGEEDGVSASVSLPSDFFARQHVRV
jgi:hypothetical protein